MPPISRRDFLGSSLKVGAGAAALGLVGAGSQAWGAGAPQAAAPDVVDTESLPASVTPAPPATMSFVTRPDLTPPGVSIVRTADIASRRGQPGYIFLSPRVVPGRGQPVDSQGLMIIDLDGNLVWFQKMTDSTAEAFNFRVQTFRGRPVLTWWQGIIGLSYGLHGTCVIADDTYSKVAFAKAQRHGTDLHEFLITPQDTALITAYEARGSVVVGHAQEVDIATDHLLFDWSSYPAVPVSDSYFNFGGDYFHINSIDRWPGTEDLLISARNTWAIYRVSRTTGAIMWQLGGKRSSFAMGPGTRFSYQHDARALADGSGVSLFDDASTPLSQEHQSWGKVFNVNTTTRQATLRHQMDHPTSLIDTGSQGNCQLLPTGGHFVGWGAEPYFTEFGASGGAVRPPLLLDGRLPDGIQNYRAFCFDWVGTPPLSELRLVVHNAPGTGAFNAYASWNGSTEVSAWVVSAATSTSSPMEAVKAMAREGFETLMPFVFDGATEFQVTAFDINGVVLGRSPVVRVTV